MSSIKITLAFAFAVIAPATAHAQWTNADRYGVVQGALATSAPAGGPADGLAGVAFSTAAWPIGLQRYDTPDNRSFGPEAATNFPYGPTSGGLGNPAAAWPMGAPCSFDDGRNYGTKTDLAMYWWPTAATPPYPACATNMHLAYNALLGAVRTCGEKCFVDIASLENIDVIHAELRGAIETWLAGKPASARLVLRITEGYVASNNSTMKAHVDFFARTVRAGQGRVQVFGIPIGSGTPLWGTWSHMKTFGVFDLSSQTYRAMIGGENHWTDYDALLPPFDTNVMITGAAAATTALQVDGAAQWFGNGRASLGRAVVYDGDAQVRDISITWASAPYVSFSRFSGFTNVNPRTVGGPGPGQRALVSLVDMGRFSSGHLGRTIARSLHDLVAAEPKDNSIRVFQQQICRGASYGVGGNCSGRSEQTYMGRLVYRALTAARLGWAMNVFVLTASSQPANNSNYASPYSFSVRSSLYDTALAEACQGEDDNWYAFQPGWDRLKYFNNPRGRGSCYDAVVRAINGRFAFRMATAYMNGSTGRQQAGLHHKLVMFGREAMFQGSFNGYPSEVTSDVSTTYDSKLVENGAIILDPGYVNDQVSAFDEAWAYASPIIGGE